jgi:hypothetical protein
MKNNPSNRGEYGRRSMKKNKLYQAFVEDGLIREPKDRRELKKMWKLNQEENDERMRLPNMDIKSVLIALGVIGIAFGCGVLVTLYYALQPQYPTPLP